MSSNGNTVGKADLRTTSKRTEVAARASRSWWNLDSIVWKEHCSRSDGRGLGFVSGFSSSSEDGVRSNSMALKCCAPNGFGQEWAMRPGRNKWMHASVYLLHEMRWKTHVVHQRIVSDLERLLRDTEHAAFRVI